MPLHPSNPNTGPSANAAKRIASVLGICLATTACETETPQAEWSDPTTTHKECLAAAKEGRESAYCILTGKNKKWPKYGECRTIVDGDEVDMYCFKKNYTPKLRRVTRRQFDHAEARAGERVGNENVALHRYGGNLFNMRRIPGMAEKCPTVMEKGEKGTPTKVYMRFPEAKVKNPRIVVFLHGNGGQDMYGKATTNVIQFTKEMQEAGDPIILIAPQDGWGSFKPEGREKEEPGNWRDFNDPDTIINLIKFAQGIYGQRAKDITLASFSGGNVGIRKILRALESARRRDVVADIVYKRIQRIAYFDSATGSGAKNVSNWMRTNPKAVVRNCFNGGTQYDMGSEILLRTIASQGIHSRRVHSKKMKWGYGGHGVFREYYQSFVKK